MKSKTALVTGASLGIGQATAERLAMAGCKVYGTSRRGAQAGPRSFEMLPLDVTSDASVAAAVREVMRLDGIFDKGRHGYRHGWVHGDAVRAGAGTWRPHTAAW